MSEARQVANQVLHTIPLVMRNTAAQMRAAASGLEPPHFRLLGLLSRRSYTLGELAEHQAVTPATISKTIATFVERGWVQRREVTHDRRLVQVEITPAGRQVITDAHARMEADLTARLADLSTTELEQLQAGLVLLRRLCDNPDDPWPGNSGTGCPDSSDSSDSLDSLDPSVSPGLSASPGLPASSGPSDPDATPECRKN